MKPIILGEERNHALSLHDPSFEVSAFRGRCGKTVTQCLAVHRGLSAVNLQECVVPVRVHSACVTGEVFGSDRCDCLWQLQDALRRIKRRGFGILLYMPNHEGCGRGLVAKIRCFKSHPESNGRLAFPRDSRSYAFAFAVLNHIGLRRIALITNNPKKLEAARLAGLEVVERIPSLIQPRPRNIRKYLEAKRVRLGHLI
jgi:3,4-dihydroxy 2-butanone 4-phosphate synthase / GTP cyclohydrolase II